CQLYNSLPFTF
nr:immunoglobulin light chain junction region [Macaca mulatta]